MDNYENFISMDLNKFVGQWVAIDKNKVIAHGRDLKEVYNQAKKIVKTPFITKVRTNIVKLL